MIVATLVLLSYYLEINRERAEPKSSLVATTSYVSAGGDQDQGSSLWSIHRRRTASKTRALQS